MKRSIAVLSLLICLFSLVTVAGASARRPDVAPAGPSTGQAGVEWQAQWGGAATALAVAGGRAYATVGPRLLALDIAVAGDPQLLGFSAPLAETMQDVLVADGLAYVAAGFGGLAIYDVSGPAQPVLVGQLAVGGYLAQLQLAGSTLFAADWNGRLLRIDVANPALPLLQAEIGDLGQVVSVQIVNEVLYIALGFGGVRVYDAGTLELMGATSQPAWGLYRADEYLLAAADFGGGLQVLDLATPAQPQAIGYLSTTGFVGAVTGATVEERPMLYVGNGDHGVLVVDFSDPAQPVAVATVTQPELASGLSTTAGQLFALDEVHGLQRYALASITTLTLLGRYATTGPVLAVAPAADFALLATGGADLVVLSANGSTVLNRLSFDAAVQGVALAGSRALVAAGEAGVAVLDLDTVAEAQIVATMDTPGLARDVALDGTLAFVADGPAGLRIYDVAEPAAPALLAALPLEGDARDVVVRDGTAYVADWGGLQLIDVTTPGAPQLLSRIDTVGYAGAVALHDHFAYVASWDRVDIIDVGNPEAIVKVGQIMTPGLAVDVTVDGPWLAVAAGPAGARLYRLGDPTAPQAAGYYDSAGYAAGAVLLGDALWVADKEGGVSVVRAPRLFNTFLPLAIR